MCMPGTALSRYINIYTDFAFKKIFGTEANKDLLISFLNQLMGLTGDSEITDVTYLNPEQLGDNINERRAVYDVYCSTGNGEHFIVEMQKAKQDHFKDRALYYSSFAIREQGTKGSILKPWDYKLMPVYVVGILNFVMDEEDEEVITRVTLKDDRNREFNKNLQFIFIEMPKFTKEETELKTFLDKWLYVIKNISRLDDKPQALTEGIFKKLFDVAEISQFSKVDRAEYEESLKIFWDFSNVLSTAERKGRAEGRAEGERETNLRNAKNLKALGVDVETISKATGLTKEEIESL
ncbi:MAG: Rpn family recombination-promoting nuclease/putative transposase [Bacteroidales bacterium]|nr:Rpn family recombination-promoting nuclease/putative transposase [Bacteroidales bacterium]